jgi:small subunit ribosomal protein SAe
MATQLNKREKDIFRLVQSNCHIASRNYNAQMKRFIHHIGKDGVPVFKVSETYERVRLAARIIAGVRDLSEVYAISSREFGQRAVIKFASNTKCSVTSSSRWTPGSLTNHQTKQFKEPKVLIVADPHADFKPMKEASYANIPVIALCDSHNNLKYVDVVIPCNNNSTESISMIFWMLAREVLMLRGQLDVNDDDWKDVLVDLFYYKNINAKNEVEEELAEDNEDGDEDEEGEENQENWNQANN